MYWYAEYCHYGTSIFSGRTLYRFDNIADRNAWVAEDGFVNGNWHREAVYRDEARRHHPGAFDDENISSWACRWQDAPEVPGAQVWDFV